MFTSYSTRKDNALQWFFIGHLNFEILLAMITRINLGGTARNSSLTITRVGIEDLGSYSCVALNRWEFKTNFAFKAKSREKIEKEDWTPFRRGGMAESSVELTFSDPGAGLYLYLWISVFAFFGFDFFLLWFRSRQQTPDAVAHRSRGCRNSSLRCACSSLLLLQVPEEKEWNSICVSHLPFCFPKESGAAWDP